MIDGSLVALKQNLNQDAKRNFAHSYIKISKTEYLIMYLLYSITTKFLVILAKCEKKTT